MSLLKKISNHVKAVKAARVEGFKATLRESGLTAKELVQVADQKTRQAIQFSSRYDPFGGIRKLEYADAARAVAQEKA